MLEAGKFKGLDGLPLSLSRAVGHHHNLVFSSVSNSAGISFPTLSYSVLRVLDSSFCPRKGRKLHSLLLWFLIVSVYEFGFKCLAFLLWFWCEGVSSVAKAVSV